jgi:murein DD-endopeptidase MepM/ murein hydrolase activator NlpD
VLRTRSVSFLLLLLAGACAPSRQTPGPTPRAQAVADHLSGFLWPIPISPDERVTSPYGVRGRRHHDGLDLRARSGDPIFAAREGTVRFAGEMRGYGLTIILDHGGGVSSLYAHASALHVRRGDRVERGGVIGRVGATGNATGPHLHFEIAWAGRPIDPVPLLPRLNASAARAR